MERRPPPRGSDAPPLPRRGRGLWGDPPAPPGGPRSVPQAPRRGGRVCPPPTSRRRSGGTPVQVKFPGAGGGLLRGGRGRGAGSVRPSRAETKSPVSAIRAGAVSANLKVRNGSAGNERAASDKGGAAAAESGGVGPAPAPRPHGACVWGEMEEVGRPPKKWIRVRVLGRPGAPPARPPRLGLVSPKLSPPLEKEGEGRGGESGAPPPAPPSGQTLLLLLPPSQPGPQPCPPPRAFSRPELGRGSFFKSRTPPIDLFPPPSQEKLWDRENLSFSLQRMGEEGASACKQPPPKCPPFS